MEVMRNAGDWCVGIEWEWFPVGNASCPDTSDYLYLTEYV